MLTKQYITQSNMKSNQIKSNRIDTHSSACYTYIQYYIFLSRCLRFSFMIPVLDMYPIRNLFVHISVLVNLCRLGFHPIPTAINIIIPSFCLRVRFLLSFHLHPIVVRFIFQIYKCAMSDVLICIFAVHSVWFWLVIFDCRFGGAMSNIHIKLHRLSDKVFTHQFVNKLKWYEYVSFCACLRIVLVFTIIDIISTPFSLLQNSFSHVFLPPSN